MDKEDEKKALAILTVLICLKFFYVILFSGSKRVRAPEDGMQFIKAEKEAANDENNVGEQKPKFTEVERWKRIVQNDMENILITLTLMWISFIVDGNAETNVALASIFLFGRTMHTICM